MIQSYKFTNHLFANNSCTFSIYTITSTACKLIVVCTELLLNALLDVQNFIYCYAMSSFNFIYYFIGTSHFLWCFFFSTQQRLCMTLDSIFMRLLPVCFALIYLKSCQNYLLHQFIRLMFKFLLLRKEHSLVIGTE